MQQDQDEQPAEQTEQSTEHVGARARGFARKHPVLAILGVAGVGLFGGAELAVGVLIGAGTAAALRLRARDQDGEHAMRERARAVLNHAPETLRHRARAVYQAARGQLEPEQPIAADASDDHRTESQAP